jgi:hypothetical protein
MNTLTFLQCLLTLHVTGLILMAGTTIVDYSAFKTFWELIDKGQERSTGLLEAISKFSRLAGIGAALLILTGIGMMALTHGVFGEQLWFRIKFGLVIILILNSLLVGRRQGLKLRKIMTTSGSDTTGQVDSLRASLNWFYLSQLIIFFVVIFLSVFKFN